MLKYIQLSKNNVCIKLIQDIIHIESRIEITKELLKFLIIKIYVIPNPMYMMGVYYKAKSKYDG